MEAVWASDQRAQKMAYDGRMAVIGSKTYQSPSEGDEDGASLFIPTSRSSTLTVLRMSYEEEKPSAEAASAEAKEAGVALYNGQLLFKARRSSSFLKKLIIDFGYSFLRKNCRASAVGLHIPQISLIEVGMVSPLGWPRLAELVATTFFVRLRPLL
ncbi:Potassium transporter 4 [Sesamum alatum]|uniref:Potassium transporter 4 n=1 Tax=Sesamum alatum TaxID=300844 RepID=A0AAE1Y1B7_9LAMI|nr:Potassium transporter 4 [Sesamum alatum]